VSLTVTFTTWPELLQFEQVTITVPLLTPPGVRVPSDAFTYTLANAVKEAESNETGALPSLEV
jgi:hypothetical protein